MKLLHVLALGAVVAVAVPGLRAQEKKGVPPKQPDPAVRQGESQRQLMHGDRVTLKNKGEATVVWQDAKNNKVYVRTKAGERPVAVTMNDIADVRPVAGTKSNGGIRPAVEGELPTPQNPNYEIRSVEVFNGPYRSVHFVGRELSQAEKAQLADLERATNRVADDEERVQNLESAIQRQANAPATTQDVNIIQTSAVNPYGYGAGYAAYPNFYPYSTSGLYPGSFFAPYYPYYYPVGYYNSYYFNYYPPLAFYPPSQPTVIVQNTTTGGASKSEATRDDLAKSLQAAQDRLRKDRETYTQASSRAVYDNSGRIVAVRFEE